MTLGFRGFGRRSAVVAGLAVAASCCFAEPSQPWAGAAGLRFDAVADLRHPAAGERYWLLNRTWVLPDGLHIAFGDFGPAWNAGNFAVYAKELTLRVRDGALSATLWGRDGTVESRLDGALPRSRAWWNFAEPSAIGQLAQGLEILRGARIPSSAVRAAMEFAARSGGQSPWVPAGVRTNEFFQVRVDASDRLLALAVRNDHRIVRRYQYLYEAPPRGGGIDRIRFQVGGAATYFLQKSPATDAELRTLLGDAPIGIDRHFGGWRGEIVFDDVFLNGETHRLPASLDVRHATHGAPLAKVRLHNFVPLAEPPSPEELDAEVSRYALLTPLELESTRFEARIYLVPRGELSEVDKQEGERILFEIKQTAALTTDPVMAVRLSRLLLGLCAVLGNREMVSSSLDAYLTAVESGIGADAMREEGAEFLRWILRRQDTALFEALAPLWLERCMASGDWHALGLHAVDFAHGERFWAALAIARHVIANGAAPPEWIARHRAIVAWCDHTIASYYGDAPEQERLWGDVSPEIPGLSGDVLRERAQESRRGALAAYAGIATRTDFDNDMIALLENPPLKSRTRQLVEIP